MDNDDLEPLEVLPENSKGKPDLQLMSVEQLQDYIAEMEAEIARVRAAIADKQTARGAADAGFKI